MLDRGLSWTHATTAMLAQRKVRAALLDLVLQLRAAILLRPHIRRALLNGRESRSVFCSLKFE